MTMHDADLLSTTRRHFFRDCALGAGRLALANLLAGEALLAKPHHAAKAKSIIYLFMAGGPSTLDLFDNKPLLRKLHLESPPESMTKGKRFAFMERMGKAKLYGTQAEYRQHGQSGQWISSRMPKLSEVADEIAIVNSLQTNNFNHAPAKVFAHTGSVIPGRPSLGSWITYGLGSESKDLPGFIVMQSGPRGPRNGPLIWGSGFLATAHQGVPFLAGPEPVFNLQPMPGITEGRQRRALDAIGDLNRMRYEETLDPEIPTRIAAYEMAYRMQASAPQLMDLSTESAATLEMYGAVPGKASFANNCLLARRLVERGVRVLQIYHTDWDHHGNIEKGLDKVCPEVDRPCAALIRDLKQRGLLDSTLVVWGGEFGRTPLTDQPGEGQAVGRNHHIEAYSGWLAGGGVKGGQTVGRTDDFGFSVVEDPVHIHDLHATVLHLLGLDHTKLTHRFQGRDFRLTDVHGRVVEKLLA
jgi:uncharacterized protein (DUF1501 family)